MTSAADMNAAASAAALAGVDVSRETLERIALYAGLLRRWNPSKNLVSPATLDELWTRHIADCLQLLKAAPDALSWVDLGSGGGLPGLVLAAALADRAGATVHCIESKLGKAAFLREAARQMKVPVVVHAERIEAVLERWPEDASVDVVTARALAPLDKLLGLANPLLKTGAVGLFPKGQDVARELTEAAKYWRFNHTKTASVTDPKGHILTIRSAIPIGS